MAGRLYCGTSGWNYNHWREIFYPVGMRQNEWLTFYSERFDTVEINNSFYHLPENATFKSWHDKTPPGFTFALKASRFMTHMKKLSDPEEPLARLLSHSEALAEKHGPILYHLPPHWHVNLERLEHLLKILPENLRHVFEFRDDSWQIDAVYDLLRRYGAGYCVMSEPSLPCRLIATADFAYIRMHSGGSETEGRYTDDLLRRWVEHIDGFLANGDVYIYFNNDYKGFAVENALRLRQLVSGA